MKKKEKAGGPKKTERRAWLTGQRLRFYPLLLGLAALAVAFVFIVSHESDFLWQASEMNLFLYTSAFFRQQLVVPGGMLTYLGTYFTQFFHTAWLGALLLCLWCALLMWLTVRAFRLSRWWASLALVPLVLVLLTDFDMGYWVYVLKLRGHFFITVMGASLAVASLWAFRRVPSRWGLRLAFIVVSTAVLYPLAGCYALAATALMGVMAWRLEGGNTTQRVLATLLAALSVVFVPMVCYRQLFYQTNSDDLWRAALPLYESTEKFPQFYWPYYLLLAFYLLLALGYRLQWQQQLLRKPLVWVLLQVAVAGTSAWGCCHYWYCDPAFHSELKMDRAVEEQNWQAVLDVAATIGEPTRMQWMMKNLALFKLGRIGNEMYNYRNGSAQPETAVTIPLVVQCGKQLYLYYGLPNYCYRWCMEDGVEYGWRTKYLKYLTRSSLVNGETTLARKYLDLLKKTRYQREWAEHYEHFLAHPDDVAKDPELGAILPLMDHEDLLASDQSVVETFLLTLLSSQEATNPLKSELAMAAALQQKDIPTFWRCFDGYVRTHPEGPVPRHYQEAAFMFGNLERKVDISGLPFDPSIPASYQEFMKAAQQLAGMSEAQLAQAMRLRFGNTYYYDYFLMRGLKTY